MPGLFVAALVSILSFAACSNPSGSGSTQISGVTLNASSFILEIGPESTYQRTATVNPSNASQQVTWTSGNTSIATVSSSGLVTGVAAGSVVITATASDRRTTATSAVSVWQNDGCGYLRYLASDPTFYGWSWWHSPPSASNTPTLTAPAATPITVICYKASGAADEAFGIHFFVQDFCSPLS